MLVNEMEDEMESENTTVIYVESTEDTWGLPWTQKPILAVSNGCPMETTYIAGCAREYAQETFSDSDRDIDKNGYRTLDEDAGVIVHGTVVVIPVRHMTDAEINEYEDARDAI
jgi:hypothetical protein